MPICFTLIGERLASRANVALKDRPGFLSCTLESTIPPVFVFHFATPPDAVQFQLTMSIRNWFGSLAAWLRRVLTTASGARKNSPLGTRVTRSPTVLWGLPGVAASGLLRQWVRNIRLMRAEC